MAWRPYENLIDGELDNRMPGKVTGWIRFFRNGQEPLRVTFDLDGDFHDDIRGTKIQPCMSPIPVSPRPSTRWRANTTERASSMRRSTGSARKHSRTTSITSTCFTIWN